MRTVTLGLGHACCTGVLCVHGDRGVDLEVALRRGGERLVLRGAPRGGALLEVVRRAREAGFTEIVLATAALDRLGEVEGVDAIWATLFSHVPVVHDRLTGRDGSLVGALLALRRLRLPVVIEAPLLALRLSDPRRLVDLVRRTVAVRSVRFYVPSHRVLPAVAPPRFDTIAPALVEALEEVEARFDPSQGVPLCAFGDELHDRFDFDGRRRHVPGRALRSVCASCAVKRSCGGPTEAYRAVHGGAGLRPFSRRPRGLTGKRPKLRPTWGPAEREAARRVQFIVLRPTIHCNQDCLFCSANESSKNAFEDPKRMLSAVARAAQRGVRRISFSGGEPTLSPHLPALVGAASRLGVEEVEVVTNAVLLARPGRVRRLVDAGLTHAFVSLHAHDEALSRVMTQKRGDHARTMSGIDALLDAGVEVAVNHVITSRNRAYLGAFVEVLMERFGGRVFLSFAFVTPQYKALEHPELVPRIAETMTYLRPAMRCALALGQPFVVGSRQGIPPCFLGPFAAWSDIFGITAESASEDTPQKVQGPACARCRYRQLCPGLWRPYAERHGFEELSPVVGEPFSWAELESIRGHHRPPPWGVPLRFEEAHPLLRDLDDEARQERAPTGLSSLPVLAEDPERTRPLRVLMLGSGRRARRLAERMAGVGGVCLVGVASPHAPDAAGWWGAVPSFRVATEAIEAVAPEAIVIAAATPAHAELVAACGGLPVLLEKPVAVDTGGWVTVAIQERFEPGLEALLGVRGDVRITQRCRPSAPDAPRVWARPALFELLHHLLGVPVLMRGHLERVVSASFTGGSRPTALRASLEMSGGAVELVFDATAQTESLEIDVGERRWARRGRVVSLDGVPLRVELGAEERMVAAFRDAVLEGREPLVPLAQGRMVEACARRLVDAFAAAGAPLTRPGAPKHASSLGRARLSRAGVKKPETQETKPKLIR